MYESIIRDVTATLTGTVPCVDVCQDVTEMANFDLGVHMDIDHYAPWIYSYLTRNGVRLTSEGFVFADKPVQHIPTKEVLVDLKKTTKTVKLSSDARVPLYTCKHNTNFHYALLVKGNHTPKSRAGVTRNWIKCSYYESPEGTSWWISA
jgi:hypothetical protein